VTAPEIPGWRPVASGKVRDLYLPRTGPDDRMLLVASDRVSAFDVVLQPGIPGKGALLTEVTRWWLERLGGGDGGPAIAHHLTAPAPDTPPVPAGVAERAMLVQRLSMEPIECVVRGYLTGSGWAEYQEHATVCGIPLPPGLRDGDRLPEPLFTPAFKAPHGSHDENITFTRTSELVGAETAETLRALSLEIYRRAAATAADRGLILADTKFEFGRDEAGTLTLADEVLTPDSSRYWDGRADSGTAPRSSFDKQIVRDWLRAHWDGNGAPPTLPDEIVQRTAARYRELRDRLVRRSAGSPVD
jgi:phosphoribosylaminoimidazole-succinocarboxamide synthase